MKYQDQTLSLSPKLQSFMPRTAFNQQMNYKQRANLLFDKLNNFKTDLQNQKYTKFSQIRQQLKNIQNNLEFTSKQKEQHFQKVLQALSNLDRQINSQKNQFYRFKKILENIMDNTNRQSQNIFDKMTKQRQNNQNSLQKYIDFKIQSFVLKNKSVWLQQDLLNFQPFKEELNYLKKQVQQFYKNQQRQIQKLRKQVSDTLDKQKQFLLNQMKRTDHQQIMNAVQQIYSDIRKKVLNLCQKRQAVEQNVLSMIQNVINSYVKDSNKFK